MDDMNSLFDLTPYLKVQAEAEAEAADQLTFELGAEAAAALSERFGGLSIRIPRSTKSLDYAWLAEALGATLADRVVEKFAGEEIYIPKNHQRAVDARHAEIQTHFKQLLANGRVKKRAIQDVALAHKLSARQIQRILGAQ